MGWRRQVLTGLSRKNLYNDTVVEQGIDDCRRESGVDRRHEEVDPVGLVYRAIEMPSYQGRMVDALAPRADEGRSWLR